MIPPIVRRGVLLDVARALRSAARSRHRDRAPELAAAEELAGSRVQAGDVALVPNGRIQLWPDQEFLSLSRAASRV